MTIRKYIALFLVATLCGCDSLTAPSARTRHESYARIKSRLTANEEAASHAAYLVYSGAFDSQDPVFKARASQFYISLTNLQKGVGGMAIGLDSNGYLLTAGHVVQAKTWVIGWFDGRIDCLPARLVYRSKRKFPADLAVIKVEGRLDRWCNFGGPPQIGDCVFGVVRYPDETKRGGNVGFAGGEVLGLRNGPTGSSLTFVDTDVPLVHGDSGGPLFSRTGGLIGVFTEFHPGWLNLYWRRYATCFLPDKAFVKKLIAADRASPAAAKPPGNAK